jgi:hypothetical protein
LQNKVFIFVLQALSTKKPACAQEADQAGFSEPSRGLFRYFHRLRLAALLAALDLVDHAVERKIEAFFKGFAAVLDEEAVLRNMHLDFSDLVLYGMGNVIEYEIDLYVHDLVVEGPELFHLGIDAINQLIVCIEMH